jgi:[acyl-carrier-protein] S-malonyltransferase
VARADKLATELGAKRTFILNVAGAFHSSLMASASAKLEAFLAGVNMSRARVPVVANVTGMPHGSPDQMKKEMVRQVTNSVRWLSCVEWFKGHGVSQYVELGPGKVLSGLIKRIDAGAATVGVQDAPSLAKTVESIRV